MMRHDSNVGAPYGLHHVGLLEPGLAVPVAPPTAVPLLPHGRRRPFPDLVASMYRSWHRIACTSQHPEKQPISTGTK